MKRQLAHLGEYTDLVTAAGRSRELFPLAEPGRRTQRKVREILSFNPGPEKPKAVRVEKRWTCDGIDAELITWSVGYGPRTQAWLLRPAGVRGKLPGIVALHDHGAFKYYGKEKIADGPTATPKPMRDFRNIYYAGRPYANELARRGFAVLVPDVFLWGSRRFEYATIPPWDRSTAEQLDRTPADVSPDAWSREVNVYNAATACHEHTIARYCRVLGTTLAGIVSHEDRIAAAYLAGRSDSQPGGIGCVGLSGGGCRSALLQATCKDIRAAVIVGMMSTYTQMLDHNIICHTWMLFPHAWSHHGDWPDLAACRAPSPLMVQYDMEDELFTPAGMKAAHRRIASHYRSVGAGSNYEGQFYGGPHKFDAEMQENAFGWLAAKLKG